MILQNPQEWERTIVHVGSKEEVLELETEILQLFDAKKDPRSFNQHNNDGAPMPIVTEPWNKGKKLTAEQTGWTEERRLQKSVDMTGKTSRAKGAKWSEEAKEQRKQQYSGEGNPNYGKNHSEETKAKIGAKSGPQRGPAISAALKGHPSLVGKPNVMKGKQYENVECPHCGKVGAGPSMGRWHLNNCKSNLNN